jgi:tagatose-6-phosphate ketose/aldose isomerase
VFVGYYYLSLLSICADLEYFDERGPLLVTSLSNFVDLPIDEKTARGLLFTPAEIAQQPRTWRTTFSLFEQHQERINTFLEAAGVRGPLEKRPAVMLIGAGTSDYISQALVFVLRSKWACEVAAVASTELLPNMEEYLVPGREYLWISFSRSGDSPEGVAVLEQAMEQHANISHLVITCHENARMAKLCEGVERACCVVLDDAVNDRSLAMTSSFTNMIVMGHCLANAWSLAEYKPVLEQLVYAAEDLLAYAPEKAERLAALQFARICFVGSGALASVAKESALKVLEMTAGQVKTMSETVLGLRHGPMAALDAETLFVCFVSGDERRAKYAKDLLIEIGGKQVVAERIAVGPALNAAEMSPVCDLYFGLNVDVADMYRAPLDVIFGQLLGLYFSVAHDLKPDSPSPGGVINRVVQKFHIY